jgi:hypothetical protein
MNIGARQSLGSRIFAKLGRRRERRDKGISSNDYSTKNAASYLATDKSGR